MPRAVQNKLYQTFVKGLVTEAGPLTYPENASIDELNTVIKVKGSRSRRLGLDYEPSSNDYNILTLADDVVTNEFAWKGVANDSTINFLVVQVKRHLFFFDMDGVPVGGNAKSFSVDLSDYVAPAFTATDVDNYPASMTSGKGFLFVASSVIDPILIEYDAATDTISVLKVIIRVRDFIGVSDGLANEMQPATISKEHYYNLRNQGWVTPGPLGPVSGTQTGTNSGAPPTGTTAGVSYDPYDPDTTHTRYDIL